ncbi:MAG TPA: hypothetical protein VFT31_12205 [Kribbella sp.]|nr:hypothetical protein [Kribbella sp.]
MLRQLFTATAAVALLAGCSGGDKPESKAEDGAQTPAANTPTTPALTAYDPPKAFMAVAAVPQGRDEQNPTYTPVVGMAGTTAVINNLKGLYGQGVNAQVTPWQVPAADPANAANVETFDATKPMTVQVAGKDTVAVAYYQRVKGTGTNKAKVQVAFRWVDPADGKIVSQAEIDVTPVIGAEQLSAGLSANFTTETFDAATGQLAVGLAPASLIGAKAGIFSVFADPTTKKTSALPFVEPAGVSNGIIVGPKGPDRAKRSLAIADALTGATKKTGLTGLEGLIAAGAGPKHVYLYGQKYFKAAPNQISGHYEAAIYAIDPATGAIVETKSAVKGTNYLTDYKCWGDGATSVVCTTTERGEAEIIGFDDQTGKKTWGYTDAAGGRIVPKITAAFHGIVYAEAETGPILMDAITGQDVPTPTPTPTDSASPVSPGNSASPTDSTSPTSTESPDESALDTKPQSPTAVSTYGGAYLKKVQSFSSPTSGVLQVLKAVG